MKKLLDDIIEISEKINNKILSSKIEKNVFEEQKENIKKLEDSYNEIEALIKLIKKNKLTNKNFVEEKLVYLLLNLSTIIWCFDQLDEFIRLVIRKTPNH